MDFYAHTSSVSADPKDWEPLFTPFGSGPDECQGQECSKCRLLEPGHGHLNKVAWWTASFAENLFPAGSADAQAAQAWGYVTGLWHDLGKFTEEWQAYLRKKAHADLEGDESSGIVDHSTAGAIHAAKTLPILGHLLAYSICGHHAGLADAISKNSSSDLCNRLRKTESHCGQAPAELLNFPGPKTLPPSLAARRDPLTLSFFTRMLFSCLVDADFLATESFMTPHQAANRPMTTDSPLPAMAAALAAHMAGFPKPISPVDRLRAEIHEQCLAASAWNPGFLSLTVPTGGGKTLSSLAFALNHAVKHRLQRVIYVIPFTSIIEQNASVFEDIFAPLAKELSRPLVIEHHSNLLPERESTQSKLATENWDAPLVVTTSVQFYESLHSARTSRCRKLHNIARSVVILDEAQCLPVDYLGPCLETLRELTAHYQTSVVLCTATQPAVMHTTEFPIGLKDVREIVPDPRSLASALRRVRIVQRGPLSDRELAGEIDSLDQVLSIVNTRGHARLLFEALVDRSEENFHLSALMCPEHRSAILRAINHRLAEGLPVRLISTQLIQAGVDVDFPRVYRSHTGIDSLGQAAGRCNRHGRLPDLGETHVFHSEHQRAEAYFRETAQIASQILELHDDPLSLESVEAFFRLYYYQHRPAQGQPWDTKSILRDYALTQDRALPFKFQFRTVAEKFQLIESADQPVIIPYDEKAKALLRELRQESIPLNRTLMRGLQRYTVPVRAREFAANRVQFESLRGDRFFALICPETQYSEKLGLTLEPTNSTSLIC